MSVANAAYHLFCLYFLLHLVRSEQSDNTNELTNAVETWHYTERQNKTLLTEGYSYFSLPSIKSRIGYQNPYRGENPQLNRRLSLIFLH